YQQRLNLRFTDIRPGFVDTPLLTGTTQFPMLMPVERVAQSIEKAIRQQRHVCIIDWRWRVVISLWRLIPNGLWRYVGRMLH
ncbi:MAG: oxidoreductase, partial [Prevotella sp.]|nr:oxidoreductase [Prevotella sp.]